MTLEESILFYEEQAKKCNNKVNQIILGAERCEQDKQEYTQLAEWLRELQERRKQPEIIYCKDCRKHNVKVGFDENLHTVWKEDACPLVNWRGKAKQHEFDYQYCTYAERRADSDGRD